jgi:hypothetical protein
MTIDPHAILIVEDDQTINEAYKAACRLAVYELQDHLAQADEVQILQAFSTQEALTCLDTVPGIAFVSIDLALDTSEQGWQEEQRLHGRDVGGMQILAHIKHLGVRAVTIVVTGEKLLSFATDALQHYDVFYFFDKARFNIDAYKMVLKSALLYVRACELLDQFERNSTGFDKLDTARQYWQAAVAAAGEVGIAPRRFPSDLELRLASIRAQFMDQVTALPIGQLTHSALKQRVLRGHQSVLRVLLVNYAVFRATYPSQADPLRFFIAGVIRTATEPYPDTFIGILETGVGDTPGFVVALDAGSAEELEALTSTINAQIAGQAHAFIGIGNRQREPVVPRANVQAWFSHDVQFTDLHELLDTIGTLNVQ